VRYENGWEVKEATTKSQILALLAACTPFIRPGFKRAIKKS